jgi:hypothetical protein
MKYCYINGDMAQYTGKTQFLYGETCYEVVMIEGHMKGEFKWTFRKPK